MSETPPQPRDASFTDGRHRVATARDVGRRWGLSGDGFRYGLCGHRFKEGDGWRWQYAGGRTIEMNNTTYGVRNFKTCDACDGPDVLDRWVALNEEYYSPRFWSFRE